jgi:putative FmdB family regulatory protein
MPTYEYECNACGHKFELFQKITADPISKCPKCGKEKARRLISGGGGVIFKGSGFYQTDYKKSKKENQPKCEKAGSKKECSSCPGSSAG